MQQRFKIFGATAIIITVLDQATKVLVQGLFPLWHSTPVVDGFFNLVHVLNRGSAFGFLNRSDIDWQRWLFMSVTILALGLIMGMVRSSKDSDRLQCFGLGLVAGGAVGNFIDRAFRDGAVVDFLDFHLGPYHWPAFNIADIGITVGAALVAWKVLTAPEQDNG